MLSQSQNLTKGKPFATLLKYSLPFILATLLQAVYNLTDMIFMGHFVSDVAVSAVGVGGQVIYLVVNAVIGLGAGSTIVIAKFYGDKDQESLNKAVTSLIIVFVFLAVILSISMFFLSKPLLLLLRTPTKSLGMADSYVKISMLGLTFTFLFNGVIAAIRGIGDSIFPLIMIFIACIINVALDFLFIAILKMEIKGAAIATIISQAACGIGGLIYVVKNNRLFKKGSFKFTFDKKVLSEFLKMGIPVAFLNFTATLSFMLMSFIVNIAFYGSIESITIHTLASRFNGFAVLPSRAMASAIAVIVSQNVGAGSLKRNKPTLFYGIGITLIYGVVVCLIIFFFPDLILKLLGAKPETIKVGIGYLKVMSFDYIILPLGVCAFGIVEGQGKTSVTMIINIIASLFIRVPFSYLLAKTLKLGMLGVGLSIPIASLSLLIMIWFYILLKRKKIYS